MIKKKTPLLPSSPHQKTKQASYANKVRLYMEREMEGERKVDGWMDGLLYNQWIDHNNTVGER